jgi:hypothetical protein
VTSTFVVPREFQKETANHPDLEARPLRRIIGFRLHGKNVSRSPVRVRRAELGPYGCVESFPVRINDVPVGSGVVIEPGKPFTLDAEFPTIKTDLADHGMPPREFYQKYAYLVLCVETDRGTFTQEFRNSFLRSARWVSWERRAFVQQRGWRPDSHEFGAPPWHP